MDEAAAEKAAAGMVMVSLEVVEDPTEVEVSNLQLERLASLWQCVAFV